MSNELRMATDIMVQCKDTMQLVHGIVQRYITIAGKIPVEEGYLAGLCEGLDTAPSDVLTQIRDTQRGISEWFGGRLEVGHD